MRKKIAQWRRRLQQIRTRMGELNTAAEERDGVFSDEEQSEWETLIQERDGLNAKIARGEEQLRTGVDPEETPLETGAPVNNRGAEGGENPEDFRNFGDFLRSIMLLKSRGISDERLNRTAYMGSGADGGFLIPDTFLSEITSYEGEGTLFWGMANTKRGNPNAPNAPINYPILDQSDGITAGIQVYSLEEGEAPTESKLKFAQGKLNPHKFGAFTGVSNDMLLNDDGQYETELRKMFRKAYIESTETFFITGDGVKKPLGILNSGARVKVTRQTAATVKVKDIDGMIAKLTEGANAGWIISRHAYATIASLSDSAGNAMFVAGDVSKRIPDTLRGFPIKWTYRSVALGTEGDVALVNFDNYYIGEGSQLRLDMSADYKFAEDVTCFKMIYYVDGQVNVEKPIKTSGGVQVSPVVVLK